MKQSNSNYEESKARYMTNDKKRYYLASVDENVQMLVNSQKEELTRVLIEHKSEYDALTRETRRKKEEEERLKHKINILEQMERKSNKKMEEAESTNETMKNALELKKKKKEEETYLKKTLSTQIEKLKTDTFLTKKEILKCENESKRLSKRVEKQKLKQNDIKERYNNVYSRITSQQQRNAFENNEQTLQLQYYNTIIEHKSMFIQSADERQERQKRIAQEAKNNSADQMEETKRKQFEMLMLYNKYFRFKMDHQLNQNAKMEETYQAIRDICGTQCLETITDIILDNERHYNYNTSVINDQEKIRDDLRKDIQQLNCDLVRLKTELPVEEEAEKNKTISPMEINLIEEKERKLLQQEEELFTELDKIEEKHRRIDLIFHKVMENMNMLCGEKAYMVFSQSNLETREKEGLITSCDNQETNAVETNQVPVVDLNEESKPEENMDNNVKQDEDQTKKETQNESPTMDKDTQPQINEPIKEEPEFEDKNKNTIQTEENTLPSEYEDKIKQFNEFLTSTLKQFNMLFLCHSKDEFLKIMQAKGIESQINQANQHQQLQPLSQTKKLTRTNIRKRTFTKRPSLRPAAVETQLNTEPNMIKGELLYEKDEAMQKDEKEVFKRFIEEMRRSREEYIRYGVKNA